MHEHLSCRRAARLGVVLLGFCLALIAPVLPALSSSIHVVEVRNDFYEPPELHIEPGDTVLFRAVNDNHTVTADDGRFDYYPNRTMYAGEAASVTFDRDETVGYYCRIHGLPGSYMFGTIVVGEGSTKPPSVPDDPEITVPTSGYPSINNAARYAPPGTIINVLPGEYRETVEVFAPGVTIRRHPESSPSEGLVVIDGSGTDDVGITVRANDVTLQDVTVQRFTQAGVKLEPVSGFRAEQLTLNDNIRNGIEIAGASGAVIRDTRVEGSRIAGIQLRGCPLCDVQVEDVVLQNNIVGLAAVNAGGLVVRDSEMTNNAAGITLRSSATDEHPPQRAAYVFGNRIADNVNGELEPLALPEGLEGLPSGVGVWISGGAFDVIQDNEITGHEYGVAVTWGVVPPRQIRVSNNLLGDSALADLAWDGTGTDVCFSQNTTADGEASSEPPLLQTTASCDLPTTVGVPTPTVPARILAHALTNYFVP